MTLLELVKLPFCTKWALEDCFVTAIYSNIIAYSRQAVENRSLTAPPPTTASAYGASGVTGRSISTSSTKDNCVLVQVSGHLTSPKCPEVYSTHPRVCLNAHLGEASTGRASGWAILENWYELDTLLDRLYNPCSLPCRIHS